MFSQSVKEDTEQRPSLALNAPLEVKVEFKITYKDADEDIWEEKIECLIFFIFCFFCFFMF